MLRFKITVIHLQLIVLTGLLWNPEIAFAQNSLSNNIREYDYAVERNFTTNEGLPANGVNGVYQDDIGYIWAATFNGLVRFNGSQFKTYDISNLKNLTSNRFTAVNGDFEGNIWAGLENGGFLKLDIDKDTATVFSLDKTALRDGNSVITTFAFFTDNTPWIGTEHGLVTIKNGEIQYLDNLPIKTVNKLLFRNGYLFVGYEDELIKLNPDTHEIIQRVADFRNDVVYFENDSIPFYGDLVDFNFINEKLYLLTQYGLIRYNNRADSVFSREEVNQNTLHGFLPQDEKIYVYGGNGIFSTSLDDQDFLYYSHINTKDLIVDYEGSHWVATVSDGITQIVTTPVNTGVQYDKLSDQGITAILKGKDGSVYIGANCDGIYKYENEFIERFGYNSGFRNNCIWSLMQQDNGTLWAGTWGHGAYYSEPQSNTFKKFDSPLIQEDAVFLSILEDQSGSIWFGTYSSGLFRVTNSEVEPILRKNGEKLAAVRMIFESQKGDIYVATDDGIGIFQDNKIHPIQAISELGISSFRTIAQDSAGKFWFGSYGGGLVVYEPGKEPTVLSTKDGLFDNTISQLDFDEDGDLWLGGNEGVFFITKEEVDSYLNGDTNKLRVSRIGVDEGMTIEETNGGFMPSSQILATGKLLIPTVRGVTVINTRRMELNDNPPTTVIEQVEIDGQVFNPSQVESISYETYRIVYRFAGLSFKNPGHNRYEYMLEGFDEEWISAGNRGEAIYTKIPPGDYVFKARASNNDGLWSIQAGTLSFNIEPPFWQTTWFYISVIGLIGMLIYGAFRYRLRNIKKYNLELKQTVESRTKELQKHIDDKNKLQSILAHDLRTPLTGIIGYIEIIRDELEERGEHEQTEMMNLLLDSSRNTVELLENLLHWSASEEGLLGVKPEIYNIVELVDETISMTEAQSSFKKVEVKNCIEESHYVYADKNMVLTVLRNLVSNAIKFSGPESVIEISLEEKKHKVIVSVKDHGVGIPLEDQEKIFSSDKTSKKLGTQGEKGTGLGLMMCKEFINKHNEEIWVSSKPDKGSTFFFSLKKAAKSEL
jgi:signal transduction histidine kinase/streptogramin lyase